MEGRQDSGQQSLINTAYLDMSTLPALFNYSILWAVLTRSYQKNTGHFVPTNPDKVVRLSDISAAKYAGNFYGVFRNKNDKIEWCL